MKVAALLIKLISLSSCMESIGICLIMLMWIYWEVIALARSKVILMDENYTFWVGTNKIKTFFVVNILSKHQWVSTSLVKDPFQLSSGTETWLFNVVDPKAPLFSTNCWSMGLSLFLECVKPQSKSTTTVLNSCVNVSVSAPNYLSWKNQTTLKACFAQL